MVATSTDVFILLACGGGGRFFSWSSAASPSRIGLRCCEVPFVRDAHHLGNCVRGEVMHQLAFASYLFQHIRRRASSWTRRDVLESSDPPSIQTHSHVTRRGTPGKRGVSNRSSSKAHVPSVAPIGSPVCPPLRKTRGSYRYETGSKIDTSVPSNRYDTRGPTRASPDEDPRPIASSSALAVPARRTRPGTPTPSLQGRSIRRFERRRLVVSTRFRVAMDRTRCEARPRFSRRERRMDGAAWTEASRGKLPREPSRTAGWNVRFQATRGGRSTSATKHWTCTCTTSSKRKDVCSRTVDVTRAWRRFDVPAVHEPVASRRIQGGSSSRRRRRACNARAARKPTTHRFVHRPFPRPPSKRLPTTCSSRPTYVSTSCGVHSVAATRPSSRTKKRTGNVQPSALVNRHARKPRRSFERS